MCLYPLKLFFLSSSYINNSFSSVTKSSSISFKPELNKKRRNREKREKQENKEEKPHSTE